MWSVLLLKATVDGIKICKDLWTWLCKILDGLCKILLRIALKIFGRILEDPKSILEDPWWTWQEIEGSLRFLQDLWGNGVGNLWGSSQGLGNIFSNTHIRIVEDLQGSWESN